MTTTDTWTRTWTPAQVRKLSLRMSVTCCLHQLKSSRSAFIAAGQEETNWEAPSCSLGRKKLEYAQLYLSFLSTTNLMKSRYNAHINKGEQNNNDCYARGMRERPGDGLGGVLTGLSPNHEAKLNAPLFLVPNGSYSSQGSWSLYRQLSVGGGGRVQGDRERIMVWNR
jgi:hypothetical protein